MFARPAAVVAALASPFALVAITASPAAAEPDRAAWVERPFTVEGQLGLASPLGVGVAADYAPTSWLSVGAGVGRNSTPATQVAVGARARVWSSPGRALFFGVAGSGGGWSEPTSDDLTREFERAYWANAELGVEGRAAGLSGRAFFGAAALLNRDDWTCNTAGGCTGEVRGTVLPYFGFALGYAFGLGG
ncbi:MAG: hypothetical protein KBG48_34710 [Kofleriaceae bacterium]|jgi:uncharacterized membrane protein|nr:hypothetical protein [Kofleriaceae bacterium]MBP9172565.1 hypothetical protein [Kofleriaceae bacterium]MBP9861882.1 hypothetical protein [Kofleriaceae bacterium]